MTENAQAGTPIGGTAASWNQRADALLALLDQQLEMMNDLAALARTQRDLVTEAKAEALLGLLSRRQVIVDRFTRSQKDLTRLTEALDTTAAEADEARCTRIRDLLERIGIQLGEVMSRDAADQKTLAEKRDSVRDEIHGIGNARHAQKAYRVPERTGSRFSDSQG